MTRRLVAVLPMTALLLSGCVPVLVGAGVTAGYMAVQERGAMAGVNDLKIKTHILDRLTQSNYKFLTKIGVYVIEGDVLLTGVVPNDEDARTVVQITFSVPGVRQVYNEIQVGGDYGVGTLADDTWIATQIKSRMVTTSDVYTVNYVVEVVRGHAYIFGIARTPAELERVMHIVRTTKGVRMVHNHVRLARPPAPRPPKKPVIDWPDLASEPVDPNPMR
jgi:osmotically-inducible protein OsmY